MEDRWRKLTYFALSLPNRPGELARFADQLHGEGINLLGLWGYAATEHEPRLSCVPELPDAFRRWAKSAGHAYEEGRTMYLRAQDRRGALVETLDRIAALGINVDAIDCVSAGDAFGWFVWADGEAMDALEELLT